MKFKHLLFILSKFTKIEMNTWVILTKESKTLPEQRHCLTL